MFNYNNHKDITNKLCLEDNFTKEKYPFMSKKI